MKSGNQNTAQFPRLQQVALVVRRNGFNIQLESASVMVVTRYSQNVSTQYIFFHTIDTNYNHKWLAGVRKPEIPWIDFNELVSKGD